MSRVDHPLVADAAGYMRQRGRALPCALEPAHPRRRRPPAL